MNKIEASQALEDIAEFLEEIAASLDQTQTPCNCCGTKVRSDVVAYYAPSRTKHNAVGRVRDINNGGHDDNETQTAGESNEAESAALLLNRCRPGNAGRGLAAGRIPQ